MAKEHSASGRTAGGRDVNRRLGPSPTSVGQRQLSRFPALSMNGNLPRSSNRYHLSSARRLRRHARRAWRAAAVSHGSAADGGLPVAALQNTLSTAPAGRNLGSVESDQLGTVGTQPARSVAIAPRCSRYRKNDRSAVTIIPARTRTQLMRVSGHESGDVRRTQQGESPESCFEIAPIRNCSMKGT